VPVLNVTRVRGPISCVERREPGFKICGLYHDVAMLDD
jgi:hypothetical protein